MKPSAKKKIFAKTFLPLVDILQISSMKCTECKKD